MWYQRRRDRQNRQGGGSQFLLVELEWNPLKVLKECIAVQIIARPTPITICIIYTVPNNQWTGKCWKRFLVNYQNLSCSADIFTETIRGGRQIDRKRETIAIFIYIYSFYRSHTPNVNERPKICASSHKQQVLLTKVSCDQLRLNQ